MGKPVAVFFRRCEIAYGLRIRGGYFGAIISFDTRGVADVILNLNERARLEAITAKFKVILATTPSLFLDTLLCNEGKDAKEMGTVSISMP